MYKKGLESVADRYVLGLGIHHHRHGLIDIGVVVNVGFGVLVGVAVASFLESRVPGPQARIATMAAMAATTMIVLVSLLRISLLRIAPPELFAEQVRPRA